MVRILKKKKDNLGFMYEFFKKERRFADPKKWEIVSSLSQFYKVLPENREQYLQEHPEVAEMVSDKKNIQLYRRYEMSSAMFDSLNAYRALNLMIKNEKFERLTDDQKDRLKKDMTIKLLDGLRRFDELGISEDLREKFVMSLHFVAPELFQEKGSKYEFVEQEKLVEEMSKITGVDIRSVEELDQVLQNYRNDQIDKTIDSFSKVMLDRDTYLDRLTLSLRNGREKTKRNMINSYMTAIDSNDIDRLVQDPNFFTKVQLLEKNDSISIKAEGYKRRVNAIITDLAHERAYKRASIDECAIFVESVDPSRLTKEELIDCIEKLMLDVRKPQENKTYTDKPIEINRLRSLFKKLNPSFINEYEGYERINLVQVRKTYSQLIGREVSHEELINIASSKIKAERKAYTVEMSSRPERLAALKSRIAEYRKKGKTQELLDAQSEYNELTTQIQREESSNLMISAAMEENRRRKTDILLDGNIISEDDLSQMFDDGEEMVVDSREDILAYFEEKSATILVSPETGFVHDFSEIDTYPGGIAAYNSYLRKVGALANSGRLTVSKKGFNFTGNAAKEVMKAGKQKRMAYKQVQEMFGNQPKDVMDFTEVEEPPESEDTSKELAAKAKSFDEALKVEVDIAAAVREANKREAEKSKGQGKEGKKEDGRATNIGD